MMGLSMNQTIDQRTMQKMSMEQHLGLRIHELEGIFFESVGDPKDILRDVVRYAAQAIPGGELRDLVVQICTDDIFLNKLLQFDDKAEMLLNKSIAEKFVISYIWHGYEGKFEIEEDGKVRIIEVDIIDLEKAYFDKDYSLIIAEQECGCNKLYDDVNKMRQYLNVNRESLSKEKVAKLNDEIELNASLLLELKKEFFAHSRALKIAGNLRDSIESVSQILQYIISLNKDGIRPVKSFLEDYNLIQGYRFFVSDRMERRFAHRFSQITKRSKAVDFESAFLNSIGEYLLVGIGVIDSEIFQLGKLDVDLLVGRAGAIGSEIKKKMGRVNLSSTGVIFFNRWKTLNRKPSILTDKLVRDFLTKRLREDREELLAIFGYEDFFENLKVNLFDYNGKRLSQEEIILLVSQGFNNLLDNTDHKPTLVRLARTSWLPDLDKLVSK